MKNYQLRSILLVILFFLFAPTWPKVDSGQAMAVTFEPEMIADQLESANLIADIHVDSLSSVPDRSLFAKSLAKATLLKIHQSRNIDSALRENDVIEIEVAGGEIDGKGVMFSGLPRPYSGQNYRAYLNLSANNIPNRFVITGLENGLIPLSFVRASSRNRTDGSNGSGNGPFLYWDQRNLPITYSISAPSFKNKPDFVEAIEESFKPWRAYQDVLIEFVAMGCNKSTQNQNDSLNTLILVPQDWPFESTAIAVTRNFYISGEDAKAGMILDSDILLNGQNFSFTTTGESNKHDIRNIVTHEVGHFLGFGHEVAPVDENATMFASAVSGETKKRDLASNDISVLRSAYAGVGTKFDGQNLHCDVSQNTVGCLAVHSPQPQYQNYWMLLGYVILTLGLGKWIVSSQQRTQ